MHTKDAIKTGLVHVRYNIGTKLVFMSINLMRIVSSEIPRLVRGTHSFTNTSGRIHILSGQKPALKEEDTTPDCNVFA